MAKKSQKGTRKSGTAKLLLICFSILIIGGIILNPVSVSASDVYIMGKMTKLHYQKIFEGTEKIMTLRYDILPVSKWKITGIVEDSSLVLDEKGFVKGEIYVYWDKIAQADGYEISCKGRDYRVYHQSYINYYGYHMSGVHDEEEVKIRVRPFIIEKNGIHNNEIYGEYSEFINLSFEQNELEKPEEP